MTWQLSSDWAVSRDSRNWILQARSGDRWRSVGFYPSPEKLLRGLYEKLLLSGPARPGLIEHVKHCLGLVETGTARLSEYIHTELREQGLNSAQPRATTKTSMQPAPENLSLDLPEPATQ